MKLPVVSGIEVVKALEEFWVVALISLNQKYNLGLKIKKILKE
ncbi:MAG: hypothetical protein ACE5K0_04430 [Candidatus Methanofastidiosia archaeon]